MEEVVDEPEVSSARDPARLNRAELVVLVVLRGIGISGLFAIPAVFLPYSWMNATHAWLGLGTLPDAAITSYLTRSLSAFYAFVSPLLIAMSFDVRRYRTLVVVWSASITIVGFLQTWIDIVSVMPWYWTWVDGPGRIAVGSLMLCCLRFVAVEPTSR